MTPVEWLLGDDTGVSSKTILAVMVGAAVTPRGGPDVPYDPSDFGRCHRLLELFPQWRSRLHEVADKHPEWGPLVREWESLTTLYVQELQNPDGRAPRLYERMRELVAEGRRAAGWTETSRGCWVGPPVGAMDRSRVNAEASGDG